MKTSTKILFAGAPRSLRRTLHFIDHPNCHHVAPDAYSAAGDHLQRHVHATQNLENPGVERPRFLKQLDGKTVRYTGP